MVEPISERKDEAPMSSITKSPGTCGCRAEVAELRAEVERLSALWEVLVQAMANDLGVGTGLAIQTRRERAAASGFQLITCGG